MRFALLCATAVALLMSASKIDDCSRIFGITSGLPLKFATVVCKSVVASEIWLMAAPMEAPSALTREMGTARRKLKGMRAERKRILAIAATA